MAEPNRRILLLGTRVAGKLTGGVGLGMIVSDDLAVKVVPFVPALFL